MKYKIKPERKRTITIIITLSTTVDVYSLGN